MGEHEDNLNIPKNSTTMNESTNANEVKTMFYGVYIPLDIPTQESYDEMCNNVFDNKEEALKLVKKYKKARFKAFDFSEDAVDFAENGAECPNTTADVPKNGENPTVGEKHSPFRGPTSQNLVKLRKGIETGNVEFVQTTIWDNPRYLIGVGDTPSILQEGFRYNALHVAAKAKNPIMCELILNTIFNIKFIKKYYVDDNNPEERAKMLLDLYLNTPDKGLNETPLHFAVKFGAVKCAEVFVSFPQCDKHLRNKYGKLPKDIICERYDGPDARLFSEQIAALLEDNYYVPVYRSEDNCAPPHIGVPFSPTSPPRLNTDPLSPRMEIHAYAGPMNKDGAEKFRKLWKTPPRVLNFGSPLKSSPSLASLRLKDHEKGLERLGNNLARKMEVQWKEYWPFLDSFIDLASEEGLRLFENYLIDRINERYNCQTPPSSSPKSPSRLINANKKLTFFDNANTASLTDQLASNRQPENSPLSELCRALEACMIDDNSFNQSNNNHHNDPIPNTRIYHTLKHESFHESLSSTLNPTFCIEKSLQVFAKRISNDIIYLLEAEYDTCTLIGIQVKQFQLMMASYRCDNRFAAVDISMAHCRLAYLIKSLLVKYLHETSIHNVLNRLDSWINFSSEQNDCCSSDDECGRGQNNSGVRLRSEHSVCLLKSIREFLNSDVNYEEISSERQCVEVWKRMKLCNCTWDSNNKLKKINGSKRVVHHVMNHKFASFINDLPRKLSFEENNPDAELLFNAGDDDISSGEDNTDEEFFTPPGTPSLLEESDDENDVFHETQLPDVEIFIEGDVPTKMDYAAYNALKYTECDVNPNNYPNIYRWQHAVGLFNEKERVSWTSPNVIKYNIGTPSITSTPIKNKASLLSSSPPYTPPQSWLRITGVNSPRASLKHQKANVSFNL